MVFRSPDEKAPGHFRHSVADAARRIVVGHCTKEAASPFLNQGAHLRGPIHNLGAALVLSGGSRVPCSGFPEFIAGASLVSLLAACRT